METAAPGPTRPVAAASDQLVPASQVAGAVDRARTAPTSAGALGETSSRETPPNGRQLVATPASRPTAVLAAGAALGVLADLLFYRRPLGVSVPLFVLALVGALLLLARASGLRARAGNLWLLGPLGFFAAMLALRASPALSAINLLTVLILLALLAAFFARDRLEALMLPGYALVVTHVLGLALARPAPAGAVAAREVDAQSHVGLVRRLLFGLFLALPPLVVFAALMASADSIFDGYLRQLIRPELVDVLDALCQLGVVAAVGWLVAGGLLVALDARDRTVLPGTLAPPFQVGAVEATTVLALVNFLFLAFGWIQVAYVLSGQAVRTMGFEAYRLYVRRGFFELLAVAALTMALILALRWWTGPRAGRSGQALRVLASLMVVLALVILASAYARLVEWENVEFYIRTGPRLYVRWFMLWLAVAFGWLLVSLWWLPHRFAIGGFLAWLGFLASVNLANPDADVAAYNLARTDDLAVRFVGELSDDAVPTLARGLETLEPPNRARLAAHLADRLRQLEWAERREGWPSLHLARRQALAELRQLRDERRLGP
jgi:hypothetical protein